MYFRFEKRTLEDLYTIDKGKEKYPEEVVKAFRRAVRRIEAAQNESDLRSCKGQRLEKMKGEKDLHSIRLNRAWRLMLRFEHDEEGKIVVILEMNNHYGD